MKTNDKPKKRILIVDDDAALCEVLAMAVETAGHEPLVARNGKEAIAAVDANMVHAVISDIMMPEMDGLELFQRLRPYEVPVILITGFAHDFTLEKAKQMGAADFLNKPFSAEQVINSVSLVLSHEDLRQKGSAVSLDAHFCRVGIDDFLASPQIGSEVFIRLGSNRYVRIAKPETPLTMDRLESYRSKGLTSLYIQKNDFARSVGFDLKQIQTAKGSVDQHSESEKLELIRASIDVHLDTMLLPTLDAKTFAEGKSYVENALQLMSESDILFDLLCQSRKASPEKYCLCLGYAVYTALLAKAVDPRNSVAIYQAVMAALLQNAGKKDLLAQVTGLHPDIIQAAKDEDQKSGPYAPLLRASKRFCMMVRGNPKELMHPREAIRQLCQADKADIEPRFTRALMDIFRFPAASNESVAS